MTLEAENDVNVSLSREPHYFMVVMMMIAPTLVQVREGRRGGSMEEFEGRRRGMLTAGE